MHADGTGLNILLNVEVTSFISPPTLKGLKHCLIYFTFSIGKYKWILKCQPYYHYTTWASVY